MEIGLLLHTRQMIRAGRRCQKLRAPLVRCGASRGIRFRPHLARRQRHGFGQSARRLLDDHGGVGGAHEQNSIGDRADAAGVAQSGAARPRAGDHRCDFQRQNYFRRQRRSGARLHSAPVRRLRRAAPGKSGKIERDHRDHAPAVEREPRSTTKAVTSNCTMSASCPIPRNSPAFPSGSSPTATKPVSNASPVWATVGSRWRRHSNDFTGARAKIDEHAGSYGRVGKVPGDRALRDFQYF